MDAAGKSDLYVSLEVLQVSLNKFLIPVSLRNLDGNQLSGLLPSEWAGLDNMAAL